MAKQYTVNPDDKDFIAFLKTLKEGDTFLDQDGNEVLVESIHDKPTHFAWHQRVFPAGMILGVEGTNIRIFIEGELLDIESVDMGDKFVDKQIGKDKKPMKAERSRPKK